MAGLRPVVRYLWRLLGVCMDALLNHAAKVEAFTGGKWTAPLWCAPPAAVVMVMGATRTIPVGMANSHSGTNGYRSIHPYRCRRSTIVGRLTTRRASQFSRTQTTI